MKKILYVASTYGHIVSFHIPYIKALQEKGYIVEVAASGSSPEIKARLMQEANILRFTNVPFEKKMFCLGNLKCTLQLAKLLSKEQYDVVSVHTSLAAFFVRLAVMLPFSHTKTKPTVINTVHGYLFDEQTPLLKRILLMGAEKFTKPATNHLLVMNKEDYEIAKKHRLYKDSLSLIPGMGIDTKQFSQSNFSGFDRAVERKELGFNPEDIIMIYAAEFSERKNQKMLIEAMKMLPFNVKLILAGQGDQLQYCKAIAADVNLPLASEKDLGLDQKPNAQERVLFAGHVNNLEYYYFISDICISSSRSEGLPFNIMEAMAMGLPVIATKVKGHTDLIEDSENGFLYDFNFEEGFVERVLEFLKLSPMQLDQMSKTNSEKAKDYSLENALERVLTAYK